MIHYSYTNCMFCSLRPWTISICFNTDWENDRYISDSLVHIGVSVYSVIDKVIPLIAISDGACLLCLRGGSNLLRLACVDQGLVYFAKRNGETRCCSLRNENLLYAEWKSIVCEMKICCMRNENLLYAKWKSVVCEMKIGDVYLRLFPQQKKAKP